MIEVGDINIVADWFLHTRVVTHKQLQKLLYFAYGIYLYRYNDSVDNINNRLFENHFEAWVHGPVEPTIYEIYKYNGINLLHIETPATFNFNANVYRVLNETLDLYGEYDADELENITHTQTPWRNARKDVLPYEPSNELLSDRDIYLTFEEILGHNG